MDLRKNRTCVQTSGGILKPTITFPEATIERRTVWKNVFSTVTAFVRDQVFGGRYRVRRLASLLEEAQQALGRGQVIALEEIVNRVSGDEQLQLSEAIYSMLRLKNAPGR